MSRLIFLGIASFSYGMISAAGVFTALAAVGLVPRFTGKTHTAKYTMLYENMVCFGAVTGCYFSVFARYGQVGRFFLETVGLSEKVWGTIGVILQAVYGIFSGIFVGCVALAIAEMLGSIPIFARRIQLKKGLGLVITGIAIGKFAGSMLYFCVCKGMK